MVLVNLFNLAYVEMWVCQRKTVCFPWLVKGFFLFVKINKQKPKPKPNKIGWKYSSTLQDLEFVSVFSNSSRLLRNKFLRLSCSSSCRWSQLHFLHQSGFLSRTTATTKQNFTSPYPKDCLHLKQPIYKQLPWHRSASGWPQKHFKPTYSGPDKAAASLFMHWGQARATEERRAVA